MQKTKVLKIKELELALKAVNIRLFDGLGNMCNVGDILTELNLIWDLLEENQQKYISEKMAGLENPKKTNS